MTTRPLSVGDALRAYASTKIDRPAVVLRMVEVDKVAYAFVVLGTTKPPKPHEKTFIFLDSSLPGFAALGLTRPTWFKAGHTCRIRENDSSVTIVGNCPPGLLLELLRLIGIS